MNTYSSGVHTGKVIVLLFALVLSCFGSFSSFLFLFFLVLVLSCFSSFLFWFFLFFLVLSFIAT